MTVLIEAITIKLLLVTILYGNIEHNTLWYLITDGSLAPATNQSYQNNDIISRQYDNNCL